MSHSTYQKPLMMFSFLTLTCRSSVVDPLGQGENEFVTCERLCEELWFQVLKLCCRCHLSTVLEAFVFLR